MSTQHRIARVVLLATLLALTVGVMPAYGAYTVIPQPDAAYLGTTTKIDISELTYLGAYGSISGGGLTVTFSHSMQKVGPVPTGWAVSAWGATGDVESQTPDIMFAGFGFGVGDLTMTLSHPVTTFGFELGPDVYSTPFDTNVEFIASAGGTPVGSLDLTVENTMTTGGARLFAISSDTPFDRVDIVFREQGQADPPPYSYALAQFRYVLAPDEPEEPVSTPASSPWSLAVVAILGIGAVAVARRVRTSA